MTPNASWDQCKALAEKHTDGPWVARRYCGRDDSWFVRGPSDERICGSGSGPVSGPNAHLIAAAPELLEALDLMVAVSRSTAGFSPMIRQKADAALRKARGQS